MAPRVERRLAAILAADVVGYSRLVGDDEAGTIARLKALRKEFIEPLIAEHRGRVVKLMGDGALVEFASAVDAVECAVAIQKGVAEREAAVPQNRRIGFRIGVNIGDIIVEDGDILGDGVNVAARLEGLAEPGGICIARNVWDQVKAKLDLGFEPIGEHRVKNIAEPITVYHVNLDAPGHLSRRRPAWAQRRWQAAAGVALLLALGGGGAWYGMWRPASEPDAHTSLHERIMGEAEAVGSYRAAPWDLPAQPSIAVLPFVNLADDPEQEYLADGITSDITANLSKFASLFVTAADSSFRYKGQAVTVRDVARDLGVRYVLEGGVQPIDDTLRINVSLIDATTGRNVWAERYERPRRNVFAVQEEITRSVAAAVGSGALERAELERIARFPTDNLQAYDLYLRGVAYGKRKTKEDNLLARQMFEKAIQVDPHYARAMADCSLTYLNDIFRGWTNSREEWMQEAERLALRAIEIDSSEPWGFVTLGLVYQLKSQNDEVLPLFEKAHALNPNDYYVKEALGYAVTYGGSAERGVELLEQAQRLNPHHTEDHPRTLGIAYFFARRYQDAIAVWNRITSRPSSAYWLYKAATYAQLGRLDEAHAAIVEALKFEPDLTLKGEHERRLALGLAPAYAEDLTAALRKAGLPEKPAPPGT